MRIDRGLASFSLQNLAENEFQIDSIECDHSPLPAAERFQNIPRAGAEAMDEPCTSSAVRALTREEIVNGRYVPKRQRVSGPKTHVCEHARTFGPAKDHKDFGPGC